MRSRIYHIFSYIFFLFLGLALLYFAFKGQDFYQIIARIKEAKTGWILPVVLASLVSYLVRTLRWRMLIQASGYRVSFGNTYHTLMFGYLVNLAIPRLGEISRCAALNKKEKVPFNVLFGTVVTERVIDIFMLGLLVGITLILKFEFLIKFFTVHVFQPIYDTYFSAFTPGSVIILLFTGIFLVLFVIGYILIKKGVIRKNPVIHKFFLQLRMGILSILRVRPIGLFLLYTGIIWLMYYFTTYLLFFAFEATDNLGLIAGLVINTISNIARTVPIQGGGLGAYHFLVTQGLVLYEISEVNGNTFATLNHGIQTLYPLVFGGISWVVLFFTKEVQDNKPQM